MIRLSQYLFLALGSFLIASCSGSDQTRLQKEIAKLEKAVEENPNLDEAEVLTAKYKDYITANPDDVETNSRFLYRTASLQFRMNRFAGAVESLKLAIRDYYSGSNTFGAALFLADIYQEKLQNQESAQTVYQALNTSFADHEKIGDARSKLQAGLPAFEDRLKDMAISMFNDSTGRIEYRIANEYINSCELFSMIAPGEVKSPEYLHKAGETARSIRAYNKALEIYEWIYTKYPDYEKAAQALFLKAFTLDNDLKRFDEARALYEEFLAKYPNDDFADDTQFLLENLGKDDEEIINTFTNQGDDPSQ